MATAVVTILLGDIVQRHGTWMVVQMMKVGTTAFVTTVEKKLSMVGAKDVFLAGIALLLHALGSVDR
tara:strand:+ start:567 stop:767 length:201 start_codon:yes stop_codon:yes gene_type:complete